MTLFIDKIEEFDLGGFTTDIKKAEFHTLREKIKLKDKSELSKIELSDDNSDFVIAYGNYIEHRNHQ